MKTDGKQLIFDLTDQLMFSITVEILSRLIDSQYNSVDNMDDEEKRNLAKACILYQRLTGKKDKNGIEFTINEMLDETVGLLY